MFSELDRMQRDIDMLFDAARGPSARSCFPSSLRGGQQQQLLGPQLGFQQGGVGQQQQQRRRRRRTPASRKSQALLRQHQEEEETEPDDYWKPTMDVQESDRVMNIYLDLPGVSKEDIIIDINENMCTINGERRLQPHEEGMHYEIAERSFGFFARAVLIPENVNLEDIKASFENGVLCVSIKKPLEEVLREKKLAGKKIDIKDDIRGMMKEHTESKEGKKEEPKKSDKK